MKHSDTITKLAAALTKAQAEMKPAEKNASNPFLKSRFADLGAVIETAREPLSKYELAISQFPISLDDRIGVDTILMHSSGEWLSEALYLPLGEERGKSQAQVMGSIITYLRRYAYASVLGIYADEDDDGHQVAQPQQRTTQALAPAQPKPEAPKPEPVSAGVTGQGVQVPSLRHEPPLSKEQKVKLLALEKQAHGGDDREAVQNLTAMFVSMFQHGTNEATYEEGAKVIASLLKEIKQPVTA